MKKLVLFLILLLPCLLNAQQGPPTNYVQPVAPAFVNKTTGLWTWLSLDSNGNIPVIEAPQCSQIPLFVNYSANGSGNTQIIPLSTGKQTRICSVVYSVAAGTAFKLTYGTGLNCAGGTTDLIGTLPSTTVSFVYVGSPYIVPSGQATCSNLGANATGSVTVAYDYF